MTLRFRHLQLRIATERGLFGAEFVLPDGLIVLRADNSMGKSTVLQAAIYALGLEGMFSGSHDVPLPHAMTDRISVGDADIPVLTSEVLLEIENASGERLTARRMVKGDGDRHLVTVWAGPLLSDPSRDLPVGDYYVRQPGAAKNAAGFHALLAEFIGWQLPRVARFDGQDGLLYLECIFPLLFVEQKRGWTAIEGRFPTHLGIKEMGTRAVEFLLRLDASQIAARRSELRDEEREIRGRWAALRSQVVEAARRSGAIVRNLPASPLPVWPPFERPQVLLPRGEEWVAINEFLADLAAEAATQEQIPVPLVGDTISESQTRLTTLDNDLVELDAAARSVLSSLQADRAQIDTVDARLLAIEEDLVRNKDVQKLRKLGSVRSLSVAESLCPTCHQEVSVALVRSQSTAQQPMSVDESISFLEEQRRVFLYMRAEATTSVAARELLLASLTDRARAARAEVRSLKKNLVADSRLPSLADLEKRVRLTERVRELSSSARELEDSLNAFVTISAAWATNQSRIAQLPTSGSSTLDEKKLRRFEGLFREQLAEYGLESIEPKEISISRGSYRAVFEGFDLQFDLSASDTIRAGWAYREALLELARDEETNHPGFLIFDEPRQQSTAGDSFQMFLARASTAKAFGQQVVVATSESPSVIESYLNGLPSTYITFDGRLLRQDLRSQR